ncbi:hypothetical protein ACOHYD_13750 [Desulfobacterota bacterium M19]
MISSISFETNGTQLNIYFNEKDSICFDINGETEAIKLNNEDIELLTNLFRQKSLALDS